MNTAAVKISSFHWFECSGSDISAVGGTDPEGYDPLIARELARVGQRGGTLNLTAPALLDLAEFMDTMAMVNSPSNGNNPSGSRSCASLAERCRAAAKELTS